MKIRYLYVLASLLWALVIAPLACLAIVGISAGIAWLYLFGDNQWPNATGWVILLLGVAGALLLTIAVIWTGYRLGMQREASPRMNRKLEQRRAMTLLIAPICVMVLAATAIWINARNYREAINAATMREAAFANLVSANQKIVGVTITSDAQGIIRAVVRISGEREGDYRINWRVITSSFSRSVMTGDRMLKLRQGDDEVAITFSPDELQRQYQAVVLGGRGGALIDEDFHFEVFLYPQLPLHENLALPPGEQRRLGTGDSPLRSRGTASFHRRFTIAP